MTLHTLQNLQRKVETANAIMKNVLEANRKLDEENARQGMCVCVRVLMEWTASLILSLSL